MKIATKKKQKKNKTCKDIFIYCNWYQVLNGVKPLYIIFNKVNGYTEDNNGNKCI